MIFFLFVEKVRLPFYVLLAIIFVAAVMLFITTYLIWRLCKERKRRKELSLAGLLNFKDGAVDAINPALTLQEQADLLPYHSKWEFPRNRLTLGELMVFFSFSRFPRKSFKFLVFCVLFSGGFTIGRQIFRVGKFLEYFLQCNKNIKTGERNNKIRVKIGRKNGKIF